jgi:hypothetical protein
MSQPVLNRRADALLSEAAQGLVCVRALVNDERARYLSAVRRSVHSSKNNLDWVVRLIWFPEAIRPIGSRQIYEGSVAAGAGRTGGLGVLFSWIFFLILVIPTMLVMLPFRYARAMSWEVEAVARPWGKHAPVMLQRWRVKGRSAELRRVVDEIAAALERGEDRPQVAGAVRVDVR